MQSVKMYQFTEFTNHIIETGSPREEKENPLYFAVFRCQIDGNTFFSYFSEFEQEIDAM